MKPVAVIVTTLTLLGMSSIVNAEDLMPWEVEHVPIASSGVHSLRIDDRILSFEVPTELPTKSFRASEVVTRGEKFDDWLKMHGEYTKNCFGQDWNFRVGVAFLSQSVGFVSIQSKLHVKVSPAERDNPYVVLDRGDFSKPEELEANLKRFSEKMRHRLTPVDEIIINGRKWYHYYDGLESVMPNNIRSLPPERYLTSRDYYVTGLAPDRYLEVKVEYSYNPYQYPTEDQRPWWMKKAFKYKEQVISSLRITRPEGSKEPDLYEVKTSTPPAESPQPLPHKPTPISTLAH